MEIEWLKEQIAAVDAEMERLKARRQAFAEMLAKALGNDPFPQSQPSAETVARKRAVSVKPLVLDILTGAGTDGATSLQVDQMVREKVPGVADGTVAAVLSRLKSAGALAYEGDRYYLKELAPAKTQPIFRVAQ